MNRRFLSLFFIIVAGEAVFMPPFVIPRLYRPLMLEAWGLTNTDFGTAFAAYGVTAMLAYLFGGPLADKYHPRFLISSSLVMTALGGVYLVYFPSAAMLIAVYAFFGVSTILLLWGALIKTTHVAGGADQRSLAMGILDSGRGLAAAVFASGLVLTLSLVMPDLSHSANQVRALQIIYLITAGLLLFLAGGIWISLKDFQDPGKSHEWTLQKTLGSLKDPNVWLLSLVILGAYSGYKGIDNYSIYLADVHKLDSGRASQFTSFIFWLRPLATLAAGWLADRLHRKNGRGRFEVLFALSLMGGLSHCLLAFAGHWLLLSSFTVIVFSAAFAYALRAIYFSVFGDLNVPQYLVGTTIGIASFVGFMPDIFFGLVTGHLIDSYPGAPGYQLVFLFTGACLFVGAAASYGLYLRARQSNEK